MSDLINNDAAKAEADRIKDKIISLSEAALKQAASYLLSRLGTDLGDDLRKLRLVTGQKLTQFIRSQLQDKYRVAPVEGLPNIMALVRAGESNTADEIVEYPGRSEPRFHYRFWAAFSVPAKGSSRYLDPAGFVFKDLAVGEDPPIGWLEIDKEFIAPVSIADRDGEIKQNIHKWLEKVQLDRAAFLQGASQSRIEDSGKSLLLAVLESLDRRQLQSTTMSLDVVASLLSKRI